jgi:hypothetical protein
VLGPNGSIFVLKLGVPRITSVSISGKRLIVIGESFDAEAVILLNGDPQKTGHDEQNQNRLVGKKVGKKIRPGESVIIQVRNPDGETSQEIPFTRAAD